MKNALSAAWHIIREPSNNNSQVALAIAAIALATVVGGFMAFFFGFTARSCSGWCSLSGGFIAIISAAGAFSVGGLLGLLFGAPSWGGSANQRQVSTTVGTDATKGQESTNSGIRPNTSLERIADWLTTMIVGLGLVHLATIQSLSTDLGIWLTREITGNQQTLNGTAGVVLALAFSIAGFLLVYLWSMRFLPSELRQSYADLSDKIDLTSKKTDLLIQQFAELKTKPIFIVPADALARHYKRMTDAGVDDSTADEVRSRYERASKGTDEPMEKFGPSESEGYKLSAKVVNQGAGVYTFVASLTPPTNVESGTVFWLLHNSYTPEVVSECPIRADGSSFENTANEAFWLGAVVPQPNGNAVRLAFDLRSAEGATDAFRKGEVTF